MPESSTPSATEPAVYTGDRARPIAEVKERAARIATGLSELGLAQNDRYCIVMRNEVGFVEATLAGGVIGAVPVPVNWHWTGDDLGHLLRDSEAKVAIVHTDLLPAVEQHKPDGMQIVEAEVAPELVAAYSLGDVPLTGRYQTLDELAQRPPVTEPNTVPPSSVIYTSGTTGLAKGIVREPMAPERVPAVAEAVMDLLMFRPGEPTLVPAPMYHTSPNVHFIWATMLGVETHIMPRFIPTEFLRMVEQYRIVSVQMVPVMFRRLLDVPKEERDKYDLSSLKYVVHAAAPCPPDLKEAMIDWLGPIVYEYYGGSEGGAWTRVNSEEALAHPGTVGREWRDNQIAIIGPDDQEVPGGRDRHGLRALGRFLAGVHLSAQRPEAARYQPWQLLHPRRHRARRRGGLPLPQRPRQRHGDLRRRQHLPGRDRSEPAQPRRRPRRRGLRDPGRTDGRSARRTPRA